MYVVGMSENGKTYFVNELVRDALKKHFKILYVVNKAFDIEEDIDKLFQKNKNVYILKCSNLEKGTIDFIKKSFVSDEKKLIIVDNFTYSLSLAFLDLITFIRKYNASMVFISHTFYASPKISPRLRELLRYIVLFYMPKKVKNDNLKMILDEDLLDKYREEVTYLSYKFMLIDNASSMYLISKIPEFKPDIVWDKKKDKKDKKNKFETTE
jgi:hypothetical protein